jgi:transcriptional regulator with XRE-family HTH domain
MENKVATGGVVKMDTKFLREVQKAGWFIEKVTKSFVVGKCPAQGCHMRAKLNCTADVPLVDPAGRRSAKDITLTGYDPARRVLRSRREKLGLSIREVEEISGIVDDHLAKMEKDAYTKVPNAQTFIEWAQSLGFEVVLRPIGLPLLSLRTITDTRDKLESRQARFKVEAERRKSG